MDFESILNFVEKYKRIPSPYSESIIGEKKVGLYLLYLTQNLVNHRYTTINNSMIKKIKNNEILSNYFKIRSIFLSC
jgi:hypothetical protein